MRNYRGLTKEGKWVYGYYVKCRGDHYILPVHNLDDPESSFDERWIQEGADEDGWIKVIPETVGQQVGLKGKNGKEIYEGDKLQSGKRILIVVWDEENLQWKTKEEGLHFLSPLCSWAISERFEIIGDIHQNPKLMGKQND